MRAIFISYRRDDAEGQAGRLFDDLTRHFGDDAVFMDVAAIEPGRDFRRVIDQQVASCGVLLAIIGKAWLTAKDETGARRFDNPNDFVRLETASALKRDIPVVPVLVQGARMPRAEDLPEDLKELAFRNGVELTHARWDSDLQLLVKALQPYVQPKEEPASPAPAAVQREPVPTRARSSAMIVAAFVSVLVLAGGGYGWHQMSSAEAAREAAALEEGKRLAAAKEEAARTETDRINREKIAAENAAAERVRARAEEEARKAELAEKAAIQQARERADKEREFAAAREARERADKELADATDRMRGRWKSGNFPPPNAGSLLYTITSRGDPACASYNGTDCLWGLTYEQTDFSRIKPLTCGEPHRAKFGVTGYEDPKHWCSLARSRSAPISSNRYSSSVVAR